LPLTSLLPISERSPANSISPEYNRVLVLNQRIEGQEQLVLSLMAQLAEIKSSTAQKIVLLLWWIHSERLCREGSVHSPVTDDGIGFAGSKKTASKI
jgi:hypothetical protein